MIAGLSGREEMSGEASIALPARRSCEPAHTSQTKDRPTRQPNPGRRSTYRRGDSVQTTGTSSIVETFLKASTHDRLTMARDDGHKLELSRLLGMPAYLELRELANEWFDGVHLAPDEPKNIVFVPGVMGSLLMNSSKAGIWWIDVRTRNFIDSLGLLSPQYQTSVGPDGSSVVCRNGVAPGQEGNARFEKYSLELQSDHTHQSVRHLLVAFELGGVRNQQLAVIKIDQGFVIKHGLGQLFVDRLALRRVGHETRIF
jgi:hypothetical protein